MLLIHYFLEKKLHHIHNLVCSSSSIAVFVLWMLDTVYPSAATLKPLSVLMHISNMTASPVITDITIAVIHQQCACDYMVYYFDIQGAC